MSFYNRCDSFEFIRIPIQGLYVSEYGGNSLFDAGYEIWLGKLPEVVTYKLV